MMSNIPVIDLQEYEENPKDMKMKMREACEEWGCFRVRNHPIDSKLMGEMKKVVRSLLDLPLEIKMRSTRQSIEGSGYEAPSEVNPLYEALGLDDMVSSHAVQSFCSQLDASPHQTKAMEAYGKAIHELIIDISEKIAECLGLEGVEDYFKEWVCQLRINKYNFTPQTIGSSGVQIHIDCSFLTILQDDEDVGGLQVMNKYGSFVDVSPCQGSFFVNLGDIAHVWSNGRFRAVKHRVECKEASVRVSIASFLFGPKEGDIEAPKELVDSDYHPRLFVPFSYEHYRKLRTSHKMHAGETLALLCSSMPSSD